MKSMTGFSQGRFVTDNFTVYIAFKSLNHKFLDFSFRGSGITPQFEKWIKELIRDKALRGKIEVTFDIFETDTQNWNIQFNEPLLNKILDRIQDFRKKSSDKLDLSLDSFLRFPMIFHLDYVYGNNNEKRTKAIKKTVENVFNDFLQSRKDEGQYMLNDLVNCVDVIGENIKVIRKEADSVEKENFARYKQKIQKYLKGYEIDEKRIAQEAAIAAEKSCVAEEINRLSSHNKRIKQLVKDKKLKTKGKELDFLSQEMQRETYTIASKVNSNLIHDHVLLIRREVEKIKQQVQNVE